MKRKDHFWVYVTERQSESVCVCAKREIICLLFCKLAKESVQLMPLIGSDTVSIWVKNIFFGSERERERERLIKLFVTFWYLRLHEHKCSFQPPPRPTHTHTHKLLFFVSVCLSHCLPPSLYLSISLFQLKQPFFYRPKKWGENWRVDYLLKTRTAKNWVELKKFGKF